MLFQSKTYDSVTDKFMDFSFEKTNSAYMLFYELSPPRPARASDSGGPDEPQVFFKSIGGFEHRTKDNFKCN